MDPYFDVTFWEWFGVFFSRLAALCRTALFADEIQLIVMGLFACSASFLGVFLVLKRLTMMANALSHTMLLGIVIALMITIWLQGSGVAASSPSTPVMIAASLAVGLVTGLLTEQLSRVRSVREDASNGMVFSALCALGVTLLSLWSRDARAGVELLMGDPDALQASDIPLVFFVAVLTLATGIVLIRGYSVAIFDGSFAQMAGFRPSVLHYLLIAQVALTSVSAFRAVGFVMTLAFFVFPPLSARLWTNSLRPLLILSVCIGIGAVFVAVAAARHLLTVYYLPVSTGALAAVILALVYVGSIGAHYVGSHSR